MIDKYKHKRIIKMDFLQNLRVSQLTEQLMHWSAPDAVDNFYKDLHRRVDKHGVVDDFVVQKWNDGYITYEKGTLKYEEVGSGKTFILRRNFNDHDCVCYNELVETGKNTGKFRFNELTFREVVTIGIDQYEYLELVAPNGEHGANVICRDVIGPMPDVNNYFKQFVDDVTIMTTYAKRIAEKYHTGFPVSLVLIWDRYEDSEGPVWSELLDWTGTYRDFIEYNLVFLDHILELAKRYGKLSDTNKQDLLNYARLRWQ